MDNLCTKYYTVHMEYLNPKVTSETTIVPEEEMTI